MDKGCKTCALDGILAYQNTCKNCVESGTFSGWTARTCENCKYDSVSCSVEPCHSCFGVKGHPNWERYGTTAKPAPDTVNHPAHYTTGCGFECIEMMEMVFGKEAVIDFCVVNAFKYIWRHEQKNGTEDIAKAEWYLKYASKLTEGGLRRHLTAINKMTDHIEKLKGEATK